MYYIKKKKKMKIKTRRCSFILTKDKNVQEKKIYAVIILRIKKKKKYKDGLKNFVTVIININDKIINES